MRAVRLHPLVYDDIDEALAHTRERFGPRQVGIYARLIIEARLTLREHPTIGALHSELGAGVRVFCIRQGRIRAPHGYIYKVEEDETVFIDASISPMRVSLHGDHPFRDRDQPFQ